MARVMTAESNDKADRVHAALGHKALRIGPREQQLGQERPKQVQACDGCRSLKIRCDPGHGGVRQPCLRCTRAHTPCIFSPRQPRGKGRAQQDARSPGFERGISVFRTSSPASVSSAGSPSIDAFDVEDSQGIITSGLAGEGNLLNMRSRSDQGSRMLSSHPFSAGALSDEAACRLLNVFVNDCSPLYPVVQLPVFIDVSQMKSQRPLLFKAAVGVAAMRLNPDLAPGIQAQLVELYSESKGASHAHPLDLLQALLVSVIFYLPPVDNRQKRQYCALLRLVFAVATGLDINVRGSEQRLEPLRAYLGCYMLAKELGMSKRKPSLLRFPGRVEHCFLEIQKSSHKSVLDQKLLSQVELFRLAERICFGVHSSEPGSSTDVSHDSVYEKVGQLCQLTAAWKDAADAHLLEGPFLILYLYVTIYLYEPALFLEHRSSDFAAPYRLDRVELTRSFAPSNWKRWLHIVERLIDAAHPLLIAFTKLDHDTIRYLPMVYWSAVTYAAFMLTKLKTTVDDPESHLAAMLDKRQIRAGSSISAAVDALENAEAAGCSAVSKPFLQCLQNRQGGPAQTWHEFGPQYSPHSSSVASLSSSVSSLDSFYQTQMPNLTDQQYGDWYASPQYDGSIGDGSLETMADINEDWVTPQEWQRGQAGQFWPDASQVPHDSSWHFSRSEGSG